MHNAITRQRDKTQVDNAITRQRDKTQVDNAQWFPDINVPQTSNELLKMLDDGHSILSVALLKASQYISIECGFFLFALLKYKDNIVDQDTKNLWHFVHSFTVQS